MNIVQQFYEEYKKWKEAGSPLRSPQKIEELFNICSSCDKFMPVNTVRGHCGICKCNIKKQGKVLNKLAWATTHCPLEEPKWVEETNLHELESANDEEKKGGCGCGK